MPKTINQLRSDLAAYLGECCTETGHGIFAVRSERITGGNLRMILDATPSHAYLGDDDAMAAVHAIGCMSETANVVIRTVDDVADFIMGLLMQIWRKADGNGGVDVRCRQHKSGKIRIRISHYFLKEILLRPEEVQVSVVAEVPAH